MLFMGLRLKKRIRNVFLLAYTAFPFQIPIKMLWKFSKTIWGKDIKNWPFSDFLENFFITVSKQHVNSIFSFVKSILSHEKYE